MGKEIFQQVRIFDDIDGQELPLNTQAIELVHERQTYLLYLSAEHRKELLDTLDVFTAHVMPVKAGAGGGMRAHRIHSTEEVRAEASTKKADAVQRAQIATFATKNFSNYRFPPKAGIRQDVLDAYFVANPARR